MAQDIDEKTAPLGYWAASWRLLVSFRGVIALLAVVAVWLIYPPRTAGGAMMLPWDPQLMRDILFERSIYGLLAVGMTLVILGGGIDLSVGSVLGMCGVCFAIFTLHWRWPVGPAILCTVGVGVGAGLISGLWVVNLRIGLPFAMAAFGIPLLVVLGGWHAGIAIPAVLLVAGAVYMLHRRLGLAQTIQPFAATLAMMVIARGVAKWFSGGAKVQSSDLPAFYEWLTTGACPPLIVVFLLVVALAWVVLWWTRTGRHLYAVGGNREAARLSGVRVRTVSALTYVVCGLTAALAGIGQVARTTLGDPEVGVGYELDAIAAVVIGGTNLMGGRGGVLLTLLGVLIIGVLEKYLSLHGWETWARLMAKGAIVVLAVAMQRAKR